MLIRYSIDYDDEFSDEVGPDGSIELVNGRRVLFDVLKRDGFNAFQVHITNASGSRIEIVSEELA